MSKSFIFDFSELKEFKEKFQKMREDLPKFYEKLLKELIARLLTKVIKRTPVGIYGEKEVKFTTKDGKEVRFMAKSNKVGGTLRRGWTLGKDQDPLVFASKLRIIRKGDVYQVSIKNNVKYAKFVEYGHKTVNGGFVEGRFFLTISEDEMQSITPAIVEKRLQEYIEGVLK